MRGNATPNKMASGKMVTDTSLKHVGSGDKSVIPGHPGPQKMQVGLGVAVVIPGFLQGYHGRGSVQSSHKNNIFETPCDIAIFEPILAKRIKSARMFVLSQASKQSKTRTIVG